MTYIVIIIAYFFYSNILLCDTEINEVCKHRATCTCDLPRTVAELEQFQKDKELGVDLNYDNANHCDTFLCKI